MNKPIIIIGAGMGGLSAGCYGQMNGYNTQIFEMHTLPGGPSLFGNALSGRKTIETVCRNDGKKFFALA
jgi:thioredoxin reductase